MRRAVAAILLLPPGLELAHRLHPDVFWIAVVRMLGWCMSPFLVFLTIIAFVGGKALSKFLGLSSGT